MAVKASASITLIRVNDGSTGPAGKGIKSITNYYLATSASSGVSVSTSGWTTTVQNITSTNRYLWNYEVVTYTDSSTTRTNPAIIGVYGDKGQTGSTGATGNGIKSVVEYYLVSPNNSGITTSTSGWSTSVPTLTATNKYLWNYEVINYTNGTSVTGSPKVIGVYGDKGQTGATGNGIKSVDVEYYLSSSSTSLSGGSWSTTAPTWVNDKYMWSRTKTVTTNNETKYSNPVCITGSKGSTGSTGPTGATGQGISSITEEYYLSTSKTSQTGGSWVTTAPAWSTGKYLWTRSKIVYKNPSSTAYTTPVCDNSWEAVNEVEVGGRNYISQGKGDKKDGFFKYFNKVENGYGEHSLTSQKTYSNVNIANGFLLGCRDYGVGKQVTISYDLMYTVWNFPTGTNRTGFWIGQRYTQASSSSSDGAWREVTKHNLPVVGENGCKLNEWFHVEKTMVIPKQAHSSIGTGASIQFYNSNPDTAASVTFRIKNVKIEYGNKATDWTPAPEDLDSTFDGIYELITNKETIITQNYNAAIEVMKKNIELTVSETYAEKGDVTSVEQTLSSKIDQTAKDVTYNFNKVNNETRNDLQTFKSEVTSYIKFDSDGMELGKSDSKFKAKLTNEKLAFTEDNTEVAYISNKKLNITDAEIENQLLIGRFAFVPRSNGNMSLKWID